MAVSLVGIGEKKESVIARVSLVNQYGKCVYDKYVKPSEPVTDYRTKFRYFEFIADCKWLSLEHSKFLFSM